jgi:hypothetical protein
MKPDYIERSIKSLPKDAQRKLALLCLRGAFVRPHGRTERKPLLVVDCTKVAGNNRVYYSVAGLAKAVDDATLSIAAYDKHQAARLEVKAPAASPDAAPTKPRRDGLTASN